MSVRARINVVVSLVVDDINNFHCFGLGWFLCDGLAATIAKIYSLMGCDMCHNGEAFENECRYRVR